MLKNSSCMVLATKSNKQNLESMTEIFRLCKLMIADEASLGVIISCQLIFV